MKILHLIIFTLVAITVMSCLNESIDGECCGNEFFPLNVGDKFLYRISDVYGIYQYNHTIGEEVVIKVTHIVDTLGKKYYEIENYYVPEGFSNTTAYVRTDKNSVYFLAGNKEVLYYQLDVPEGSFYKVPYRTNIDPDDDEYNWTTYIQVLERDKSHILFWHNAFLTDMEQYVRLERGKGRTQVFIDNWVRIRYDLVKVYR